MNLFLKLARRGHRDESGITGLETAIILIAFVIVASVFAFVVLSTGLFSAERGKQTVFAGLEKASGNIELRGDLVVSDMNGDAAIDDVGADTITFNLALVAAGRPVNLDPAGTNNTLVMNYIDGAMRVANIGYTVNWLKGNAGTLLEAGELAEVTVPIPTGVSIPGNQWFSIEIIPNSGGTLLIERQLPAAVSPVMNLH